ncbi:YcgJ family protein [Enterobacter asburiae]|uniref:YcgJ family protein n=1 Tax=Enterobacter asburiae TaxID=61645 RepID=UPI0021CE54E8|nr:YcgJ family protein [Enterobacter asburiae]
MKKLLVMAVLLGMSTTALAADIYSPASGVVCDKKAGYCVDNQGIAMGLTALYLGKTAEDNLQKSFGDGVSVDLSEYTFSNGVHCDSKERQCYKDRFYPRTPDKKENTLTQKIFGKAHQGK